MRTQVIAVFYCEEQQGFSPAVPLHFGERRKRTVQSASTALYGKRNEKHVPHADVVFLILRSARLTSKTLVLSDPCTLLHCRAIVMSSRPSASFFFRLLHITGQHVQSTPCTRASLLTRLSAYAHHPLIHSQSPCLDPRRYLRLQEI